MKNKVLLIDDSKTQLDVMRVRFTKCDFEVETAQNALEGYHKIFTFVPDIILSDIIMPDLDGYQFCRLLKQCYYKKYSDNPFDSFRQKCRQILG